MELKAFDINDWFLFNVKHCHTLATNIFTTRIIEQLLFSSFWVYILIKFTCRTTKQIFFFILVHVLV